MVGGHAGRPRWRTTAIRRHLKSQVATARAVGVTPQAVSDILRRGKRVPAEWCLELETATGGAVSAHDLRPDLYPAEKPERTRGKTKP